MKIVQSEAVTTANHVSIRIDEDEDDGTTNSSCCAVCMEPSEWVIVGACGHREVCLNCSVRLRFFQDDRRCCICRALCDTVVVTRPNTDSRPKQHAGVVVGGGSQSAVFSETSPAFGGARPAGSTHRWYHSGAAAYFDDRAPYEAVTNMCSKPLPSPSPSPLPSTGVPSGNNHGAPQDPDMDLKSLLAYVAIMTLLGALGCGIPLATYVKHGLLKAAVVIGCGLPWAAFAYFGPEP